MNGHSPRLDKAPTAMLTWSNTTAPKAKTVSILYDPQALPPPSPEWADPGFWADQDRVRATLGGRGGSSLVEIDALEGVRWAVLRRYQRGGWMAKLSADRYLYPGLETTRAFREYRLLAQLAAQGLAVPKPLLACVERVSLWGYRQALITEWIAGARPINEVGATLDLDWDRLASVLAALLDVGVYHPDLNATNILIDDRSQWWVIDFDRARIGTTPRPGKRMVARLCQSITKLGLEVPFDQDEFYSMIQRHRG